MVYTAVVAYISTEPVAFGYLVQAGLYSGPRLCVDTIFPCS